MDALDFDDLTKRVGTSRSRRYALWAIGGVLGGLLPAIPGESVDAGKKKKRKKKKGEKCGPVRCSLKQFCCDDLRGVCCTKQAAACCNAAPGTGICCAKPNDCGKPWGNDSAPDECCPPERQWFTRTGIIRCCPTGTRSLGTGITSDDGPCCPEEKYCSTATTGGKCCGDLAPICLDKTTGECCSEANRCGSDCCGYGSVCCNGRCCPYGQICDGGVCKCPVGEEQCGTSCCKGTFYGCDGNRCKLACDDSPYGCGG